MRNFWVQIIPVTLYYRENGGNRFVGDAFPVRIGYQHIDDCTDHHHSSSSDSDSVVSSYSDNDSDDSSLSPSLLIHTSRLRKDIEEWSKSWRELSIKKKNEDEWQGMIFRGHTLCLSLERELEESYALFTRNKQFVVRLQERPIYHLKLMNVYNVDWPIWTSDIGKKDYYDGDGSDGGWEGWKTKEQEEQHWNEGRELERQLQEQLAAGDSTVDWNVFLVES